MQFLPVIRFTDKFCWYLHYQEHYSKGRPCILAIAHSVGLGIPNAICPSIKESGSFATAQLNTRLGMNGVAAMPTATVQAAALGRSANNVMGAKWKR